MKTITTTLLLMAAVMAGAIEKPRLEVTPISASRASVTLLNTAPGFLEATFSKTDGSVIYSTRTNEGIQDYQKVFDFSDVEDGNYLLTFKINNTSVMREIAIERGSIKVGDSNLRYDPYVTLKDNTLKLSYLNFDQRNVKFTLRQNNDVVYEANLGRDFSLLRGFDLSKLASGKYETVISDGRNTYFNTFVK